MKPCAYPIERILPHAGPMILLDDIEAFDDTKLEASVKIRRNSRFMRSDGMPAHVVIEYMAQACCAFSGVEDLCADRTPRVGFLLGTRAFRADRAWIGEGERLKIAIGLVFRDNGMAVFGCTAAAGGIEFASAQLTVYQPSLDEQSRPDND